jgi:peptide/nickel transport system permease protein
VKTYLLKRLMLMMPTLVGITLLTYGIVRLAPGDPIAAMIRAQSGNLDPKVMRAGAERIRERLGLKDYNYFGDPAIGAADKVANVFTGYARWIGHVVRGDFGESVKFISNAGTKNPLDLIRDRIAVTLILNLFAEGIIFVVALPIGLAAARHQGRFFDRISSVLLLGLWSIPAVLAGTLLIALLGRGGIGWHIFPVANLHSPGYEDLPALARFGDLLWHVALPVLCMVYGGLTYLAKLGRASLLENLRADYVRTARAKGVSERRVVYHHAFRNSLLPMITTMVMMLPAMIGGSVVVEQIFSIPGTGQLFVDAARSYDLSVVMADTLLYGFLTLLALIVGDVLYAWADPRIRYE